MKLYTYTQAQLDKLYAYLVTKPMREVEEFVTLLRNPVKLEDDPAALAAQQQEASADGQEQAKQ